MPAYVRCEFCGTEQRPLGTTSGITFCYANDCLEKAMAHIREHRSRACPTCGQLLPTEQPSRAEPGERG